MHEDAKDLLDMDRQRHPIALVVEYAQHLAASSLEFLVSLASIPDVTLVLVGTPDIDELLEDPQSESVARLLHMCYVNGELEPQPAQSSRLDRRQKTT